MFIIHFRPNRSPDNELVSQQQKNVDHLGEGGGVCKSKSFCKPTRERYIIR